mmetsp:Transcript_74717/g.215886  ORF Transcript_74717/g.215886 Transcript_74717/m.215886 type:complete len:363 (-) Transcript_74717:709-1797(-)
MRTSACAFTRGNLSASGRQRHAVRPTTGNSACPGCLYTHNDTRSLTAASCGCPAASANSRLPRARRRETTRQIRMSKRVTPPPAKNQGQKSTREPSSPWPSSALRLAPGVSLLELPLASSAVWSPGPPAFAGTSAAWGPLGGSIFSALPPSPPTATAAEAVVVVLDSGTKGAGRTSKTSTAALPLPLKTLPTKPASSLRKSAEYSREAISLAESGATDSTNATMLPSSAMETEPFVPATSTTARSLTSQVWAKAPAIAARKLLRACPPRSEYAGFTSCASTRRLPSGAHPGAEQEAHWSCRMEPEPCVHVPSGHTEHSVASKSAPQVPEGHLRQATAPVRATYVPGAQRMQVLMFAWRGAGW